MKKSGTCCNLNCRTLTTVKCDKTGVSKFVDSKQSILLVCDSNEQLEVWVPDKCDILTTSGQREMACDFLIRRRINDSFAIRLLELKDGGWSYSHVRKQFIGGLRTASALKLKYESADFFVVAEEGGKYSNGATRSLGGLQTICGRPILVASKRLEWRKK